VVAGDQSLAIPAGALGVILLLGACGWICRVAPDRVRHLVPIVAVGVFSVGSVLGIGLGRAQLGVGQASAARYVTWASLLWISNAALLGLLIALSGRAARWSLGTLCGLLVVGALAGVPAGLRDGAILSARVRETRDTVLAAYPDVTRAMLRGVTPVPERALRMLPRVERLRLSLFRER
jgi:hypothetical protein